MVGYPLATPYAAARVGALTPALRVQLHGVSWQRRETGKERVAYMESTEVNGADVQIDVEVDTFTSPTERSSLPCTRRIVRNNVLVRIARVAGLVEEALVSNSDQVVLVDGLDESGDLRDPVGDGGRCASTRRSSEQVNELNLDKRAIRSLETYPVLPAHLGSLASSQAMMVGSLT